jgi:hypothetical protein
MQIKLEKMEKVCTTRTDYLLGPIRPVLDLKAFDPVLRPKDGTPEGQLCP